MESEKLKLKSEINLMKRKIDILLRMFIDFDPSISQRFREEFEKIEELKEYQENIFKNRKRILILGSGLFFLFFNLFFLFNFLFFNLFFYLARSGKKSESKNYVDYNNKNQENQASLNICVETIIREVLQQLKKEKQHTN